MILELIEVIHRPSGFKEKVNQTVALRLMEYSKKHDRGWEIVEKTEEKSEKPKSEKPKVSTEKVSKKIKNEDTKSEPGPSDSGE